MNERCTIPVVRTLKDYQAYRISPGDRHRLAIVCDPSNTDNTLTVCVEIFDVGSATPPHRHNFSVEMFFILKGEATAVCDGKEVCLNAGDSLLIPKTGTHYLKNRGSKRLYALCIMIPNEDFSELIRNGIPAALDEQDLEVLSGIDKI